MTENFRKAMLNRLPAVPPPMAPTRAPWAETDQDADDIEDLEGEDTFGDFGASFVAISRFASRIADQSACRKFQKDLSRISHPCRLRLTLTKR